MDGSFISVISHTSLFVSFQVLITDDNRFGVSRTAIDFLIEVVDPAGRPYIVNPDFPRSDGGWQFTVDRDPLTLATNYLTETPVSGTQVNAVFGDEVRLFACHVKGDLVSSVARPFSERISFECCMGEAEISNYQRTPTREELGFFERQCDRLQNVCKSRARSLVCVSGWTWFSAFVKTS